MGLIVISPPFTIVTVITIILIFTIVAVYLSILKRNGWLGETYNYRCPNPKCKKIFQTPLKVKDFSNSKEVHLACPECGCDLEPSVNGENGLKEITPQIEPEVKIQDSTSKPIETKIFPTNYGSKEPKALGTALPMVESKKNEGSPELSHNHSKQKLDKLKKDGPAGCTNFFGYLGSLPKGTKTPDECYFCPRLIECGKKGSD